MRTCEYVCLENIILFSLSHIYTWLLLLFVYLLQFQGVDQLLGAQLYVMVPNLHL